MTNVTLDTELQLAFKINAAVERLATGEFQQSILGPGQTFLYVHELIDTLARVLPCDFANYYESISKAWVDNIENPRHFINGVELPGDDNLEYATAEEYRLLMHLINGFAAPKTRLERLAKTVWDNYEKGITSRIGVTLMKRIRAYLEVAYDGNLHTG